MTIALSDRKGGPYEATPGQTIFNYGFPIDNASEISVVRLRAGVLSTLVLGSDYSVTGVGNDAGGTIVLSTGALAGDRFVPLGKLPIERTENFPGWRSIQNGGIDNSLDRMIMALQEMRRDIDGTLSIDPFTGAADAKGKRIINVANGVDPQDAATVDQIGPFAEAAAAAASVALDAQTAAETAASNTAALYDSFDDRYLGSKSSAPALDNDGNALVTGALYFDNTLSQMRVWSGTLWLTAYVPANALIFKGAWDASSGSYPGSGAALTGSFYLVSVAGTVNGISFSVGDEIYAVKDNASTTTYASNWQKIDGAITAAELLTILAGHNLVTWDSKTPPSGAVVGTTDAQNLTNKTLTSPAINSPTGIVKGDVGLGNVDNTSDATKNAAAATLTNKTLTNPAITDGIFTGGPTFGHALRISGFLTATLTVDVNNYAPANFGTSSGMLLTASANVAITGIAGGTVGRLMFLYNAGASNNITIKNNSTSSSAANRIQCGADLVIAPGKGVLLHYENTNNFWRVVGGADTQTLSNPIFNGVVLHGVATDPELATYPSQYQQSFTITSGNVGSAGAVVHDVVVNDQTTSRDNGAVRGAIRQDTSGNSHIRAGEFQTIRSVGDGTKNTWALELGVHSSVAGTSPLANAGIYLASSHTGWLPSGVRNGDGIHITGEDGWINGIRYVDTDSVTELFKVDQNGSVRANGNVYAQCNAVPAAGGAAGTGIKMSNVTDFGIFFGSGAPTLSAAKGSLYLRTDGSSTSTRLYVNTNGTTGWTNVTTAA